MKAILTKYIPATNTRESQIKAWEPDGQSVSVGFNRDADPAILARMPKSAFGDNKPYYRAAYALIDKLGWKGELIGGGTKDGMAFVFVEMPTEPTFIGWLRGLKSKSTSKEESELLTRIILTYQVSKLSGGMLV